jgi:hypothetical protein
MSVDCWEPMLATGLEKTHYAFRAGKGVVSVLAGQARDLGFRVGAEPTTGNPHHGGIWPPDARDAIWSRKEDDRRRRELSRKQTFVSRGPQ